jgi:predicted RecB family nuclease
MIPLPDGTFRFSPRDLVAYLEGDFAAWCERMDAERQRAEAVGNGAPGNGAAGSGVAGDGRPGAVGGTAASGAVPAAAAGFGNGAGKGPGVQPPAWFEPDAKDEELALAAKYGQQHELDYLAGLRARFPDLVEIVYNDPEGETRTRAAMDAGAPVIFQAHLAAAGWHGYPDFLYRCRGEGCPCGGRHYTPWDTKLARSARPHFLVQLCAYADMLEAVRGYRPGEIVFVLGQGEEKSYPTGDFFYYYRQLRRSFSRFQSHWSVASIPDPGLDRGWGRWESAAERRLEEADHLSRVANITRGQVQQLEQQGIRTLAELAGSLPSRKVSRMNPAVFERLQAQARLQLESRGRQQPLWQARPVDQLEPRRGLAQLPPPCPGDVFFDIEGFPYASRGLEYLLGVVTVDGVAPEFRAWWAHDDAEERIAFEAFIDWLMARRQQWPDLHVYHYAPYEESALKRLMGKHATREAEVDDLLRGGTLVDLLAVVRQGFVIGTPSYSLKKVERLYRGERTEAVSSAGGSVVEYQRWLDSGQPRGPAASPLLQAIEDYNQVDCDSLHGLRSWLVDRQTESGIDYRPDPLRQDAAPEVSDERREAEALAARLVQRGADRMEREPEAGRLDQLIGWLVEFHRREEKPMWWRRYDRHNMTIEERVEDRDCLARLARTDRPARKIKRSLGYEYGFDRRQETKIEPGDKCLVAGTELKCTVETLDEAAGRVEIKIGSGEVPPPCCCLIPDEWISAEPIKAAVLRYAEAWERGATVSRAVDDLLRRRSPRLRLDGGEPAAWPAFGSSPVPLEPDSARSLASPGMTASTDQLPVARDLVARLDGTTLCIQGPPGTGKTYTSAALIVDLLRRGARVGVTGHSHQVILNLMDAVVAAQTREHVPAPLYKVGGKGDDAPPEGSPIQAIESAATAGVLGDGAVLVGGTAWAFCRDELQGAFDYLFVDEAGQVSLANAVAAGQAARNLVLVGDQMQLAQPSQGSHPGETGRSCLEYLLNARATVPPDLGIFLARSRRMHPDVCRFVSQAIYEGRLDSIPETARQRIVRGAAEDLVQAETGVVWVPVAHDGCTQSSEEECDAIVAIVGQLLRRRMVGQHGVERPMTPDDILIVAPFNLQVRCLRDRLDPGIRIGSVDKFQGQEAAAVIVSLCASTLDEAPRGASFLLSPNRLNVAVSRAQALAVVVGSPRLVDVRCRSVEEMKLVNLLCHLLQYAESLQQSPGLPSEAWSR